MQNLSFIYYENWDAQILRYFLCSSRFRSAGDFIEADPSGNLGDNTPAAFDRVFLWTVDRIESAHG